jgi:hypothetical protein
LNSIRLKEISRRRVSRKEASRESPTMSIFATAGLFFLLTGLIFFALVFVEAYRLVGPLAAEERENPVH